MNGPKVTQTEMELFYVSNEDFKRYVDRYSIKHKIEPRSALQHVLVKYAYLDYVEKAKKAAVKEPEVKIEKEYSEDKAC